MSDLLRQIERKVDEYGVTGNDDSGVMYETLQEMARDLVEQEKRIRELEGEVARLKEVTTRQGDLLDEWAVLLRAVGELDYLTNAEAEVFASLYGFDPGFVRKDELDALLKEVGEPPSFPLAQSIGD